MCPPAVKQAKHVDRLLNAKRRAGNIGEESGGPMAFIAGLQTLQVSNGNSDNQQGEFPMEESNSTSISTSASAAPLLGTTALVQKHTPNKNQAGSAMIEALMQMQIMTNERAEKDRIEARKAAKRERCRVKRRE